MKGRGIGRGKAFNHSNDSGGVSIMAEASGMRTGTHARKCLARRCVQRRVPHKQEATRTPF